MLGIYKIAAFVPADTSASIDTKRNILTDVAYKKTQQK